MRIRTLLLLAFCFFLSISTLPAQRRTASPPKVEDLPRIPVDTLATDDADTQIILYTDNTFSYYRPQMELYDQLPVFAENWDTARIFSYRSIELKDLPERIDLCLLNSAGEFHVPVQGAVTSKYGMRRRRHHNGADIPMKSGTPVHAAFDGKVRYARYNAGGYGNLVIIRHKNGLETWYAHLIKDNVTTNDYVKAGQVIGYVGNTGRSFGSHLHFEVRYSDQTFDPEFLVDFEAGRLKSELFALEKSYFNIHSRASEVLIEDDVEGDSPTESDEELMLLARMGDTTASEQLLALAVAREQETERKRKELAAAVYHTVTSGDMLGKIAPRYGVTVDQLCRLNGISRTTTLRLGQKLRVK